MFIVSTSTYPPDKTTVIVEKFKKHAATPLPSYMKRTHVLTAAAGDSGSKVLAIYEVDDDKVADGIKELVKYLSNYFDVEGFRYTIEPMLTAQEAIPLLDS